jgi:hypothetical protein
MAKGTGLIGNFRGKVGNMVGYNLKDSNNKQTQGVRVYQPIVKNPKTAAQAEQRAKLLVVNATYRALKMIIDRGNEGQTYGNKSRLAWLKTALKAEKMPWFEKGKNVNFAVGCPLTKGSLGSLFYDVVSDALKITVTGVSSSTDVSTIGKVSTLLKGTYSFLKDGDQITTVVIDASASNMTPGVHSFIIDTTSTDGQTFFVASDGTLLHEASDDIRAYAVIVSRLGDNGEHLRSTEVISIPVEVSDAAPYDADSKAAAIASYRASAAASGDWAEESIQ